MRPQDRLVACELEPKARKALIGVLRHDEQARVVDLDGWMALPAFVPPKERRGLVLIDPPFEARTSSNGWARPSRTAFAKWPTGIYVIWYPAKSRRATDTLVQLVARLAAAAKPPGNCLRLEFSAAPQVDGAALTSAGLLIVNPPYTLQSELKTILPELEMPLGQGGAARFRLEVPRSRNTPAFLGKICSSGSQSAKNRIMLFAVTGFTFRFREWLRRSEGLRKIQSDRRVRPRMASSPGLREGPVMSRRASASRRRSNEGEFPDGQYGNG